MYKPGFSLITAEILSGFGLFRLKFVSCIPQTVAVRRYGVVVKKKKRLGGGEGGIIIHNNNTDGRKTVSCLNYSLTDHHTL